ncbi:site-specific integrase [Runella zeae]|uniref:site-specific integrase n=1 Tax=Runella zeae TaxID=94255 RepID=UPI0023540869|nr:site-specific integrase [Runella zeae]
MATKKVYIDMRRPLQLGQYPLYLRVTKDRKSRYVSLGFSCKKELWDEANNLPKKRHPLYKEITIAIEKAKLEANREILNLHNGDQDFSTEELKNNLLADKRKSKLTVFEYFDSYVGQLKANDKIGSANIYHSTKKSIMDFRNGRDMEFSDVTHSFLKKFEEYHLKRGMKPNAFFVYFRHFKTLVNHAKKEGFVKKEYDPFKDIDFKKYRRIKTKKRALKIEEMDKIKALVLPPSSKLFHAHNYFLFSYYCWGINFIDIAHLRWTDLQNERLHYIRKKTNDEFDINLNPVAIQILDYYRQHHFIREDAYIFPILSDFHKTPVQIDNRIDKVLKQVNHDLKEIAKLVSIDENLTTYSARHTFATTLYRKEVPTARIKELMGHETERVTEIYLQSFDTETLSNIANSML